MRINFVSHTHVHTHTHIHTLTHTPIHTHKHTHTHTHTHTYTHIKNDFIYTCVELTHFFLHMQILRDCLMLTFLLRTN